MVILICGLLINGQIAMAWYRYDWWTRIVMSSQRGSIISYDSPPNPNLASYGYGILLGIFGGYKGFFPQQFSPLSPTSAMWAIPAHQTVVAFS